jgi:hypothetical protein
MDRSGLGEFVRNLAERDEDETPAGERAEDQRSLARRGLGRGRVLSR